MGRVVTSGSLGGLMVSTLAQNARKKLSIIICALVVYFWKSDEFFSCVDVILKFVFSVYYHDRMVSNATLSTIV